MIQIEQRIYTLFFFNSALLDLIMIFNYLNDSVFVEVDGRIFQLSAFLWVLIVLHCVVMHVKCMVFMFYIFEHIFYFFLFINVYA